MMESRVHIRYRDYIHDMKVMRTADDLGRPDYCSEEMWTSLCDYWDSPEAQRGSEAGRVNRMSEPDGPSSGINKHRGGSKSVEILAQEMRMSWRLLQNEDKTQIFARYISMLWVAASGKKKRMFGIGTLGLSLLSDGSIGSNADTTHLHSQKCDERYSQIQGELDLERERRQRREEEMQAERESRQCLKEQVQATHRMMHEFLMQQSGGSAGGTGFPPPSGPS
ncbi:hypothetical protein OROMI_018405 [Orobanche minor]